MMSANTGSTFPNNKSIPAKQAQKSKKRRRVKQSPDELYKIESTDRYNKLHHACSKHLHREAKVVKSFECQKIVRAIKAAKESLDLSTQQEDDDGEKKETSKSSKNSKALKRLETLQQKLDCTKKMDLDVLVQVGLKRLGVLGLDPIDTEDVGNKNKSGKKSSETKRSKSEGKSGDTKEYSSQSEDPFYQSLLESMLQHKRLSTALDQLNEKVTEYRQWSMRREAMLQGDDSAHDFSTGNNKKKKKQKNQQGSNKVSGDDTMIVAGGFKSSNRGLDLGGHEGASGLFIGSLSGMPADGGYADGEGNYNDEYGEEEYYEEQPEKRKNRPGQRARRAKAMAIEAKKAGKTWDSSINWREKKAEKSDEQNDRDRGKGSRSRVEHRDGADHSKSKRAKNAHHDKGDGGAAPKEAQHIATMGKVWKEEGNAHPSWAAKAAQKSQGIAKFAGTKITFD